MCFFRHIVADSVAVLLECPCDGCHRSGRPRERLSIAFLFIQESSIPPTCMTGEAGCFQKNIYIAQCIFRVLDAFRFAFIRFCVGNLNDGYRKRHGTQERKRDARSVY